MCHPEVPETWERVQASRREIVVDLPTGEQMPALSVGGEDAPGVLLIGDVYGRSAFYEQLAAMIAVEGLQVLVPDFYFRQGPLAEQGHEAAFARRAKLDEKQSVEDLRAGAAWLRSRSGSTRVGVVGFCMGGTFALDLASTDSALVTVAYYGFPVPQATIAHPPARPIDLVENLRGPVLAFWGDQDEVVGVEQARSYIKLAAAYNPEFRGEILPGLGHAFLAAADLTDPEVPATRTWQDTLAHLRDHLTS
jgi:carboxymethylenebutenolidase